jgi:hypothetical protein
MAGRWSARAANADLATRRLAVTDHRGERPRDGPSVFATFIVRVSKDEAGTISGVVEWVRMGKKVQFHGLAAFRKVITLMVERAVRDQESP